ncbi:MAG: hypothetical protein ACLQVI_41970, partial [Polyangiaceae bacterium]
MAVTRPKIAVTPAQIAGKRPKIAVTPAKIAGKRLKIAGKRPKIAVTPAKIAGKRPKIAGTRAKIAVKPAFGAVRLTTFAYSRSEPHASRTDRDLVLPGERLGLRRRVPPDGDRIVDRPAAERGRDPAGGVFH